MSTIDTAVIKRQDFPTMVQSYQSAMAKIDQAFTLFQEASDLLTAAFGGNNFNVAHELVYHRGQDDVKLQLRKNAWRSVLDRLEIEKVMSNKQLDETEKRFQDGKNIPEITLDTLKEISFGLLEKAPEYANELFKEAYKFLMTGNNQWDHYKTNEKNARRSLGKKVILRWIVESSFGNTYSVNSYRAKDLLAVDKVFHILDGKGFPQGYRSPLLDAITTTSQSTGKGQTDYFEFQCYQNNNLHLQFKRLDLVKKLNQISGDNFSIAD